MNDERYVRRGENAAVDVGSWHCSLHRADSKRRGRPYVLPPTMLDEVRRLMFELHLSFRAAEGHLRRMLSVLNMKAPDLTTIWKRLSDERAARSVPPREAIVAIDSTGFTTTLRGDGFEIAGIAVEASSKRTWRSTWERWRCSA